LGGIFEEVGVGTLGAVELFRLGLENGMIRAMFARKESWFIV